MGPREIVSKHRCDLFPNSASYAMLSISSRNTEHTGAHSPLKKGNSRASKIDYWCAWTSDALVTNSGIL